MNELILSLVYPFLSFKDLMNCRQINCLSLLEYNKPLYWIFINLTDTGTRSWLELLPMLQQQNQLDFLCLSGKKNFSIPISLLPQISNTKLLIY